MVNNGVTNTLVASAFVGAASLLTSAIFIPKYLAKKRQQQEEEEKKRKQHEEKLLDKATELALNGLFEEAIKISNGIIQMNPNCFGAHKLLLSIFISKANNEDAEKGDQSFEIIKRLRFMDKLSQTPAEKEICGFFKRAYFANYDNSVDQISTQYHSEETFLERALTYQGLAQYDKALEDCDRVINSADVASLTVARAHHVKATILVFCRNQPEQAMKELSKGLEICPRFTGLMILRARIMMEQQLFSNASVEIEKVLKLNPHSVDAQVIRARLLYFSNRVEESITYTNKVLEQNPEDYSAIDYCLFLNNKLFNDWAKRNITVCDKALASSKITKDVENLLICYKALMYILDCDFEGGRQWIHQILYESPFIRRDDKTIILLRLELSETLDRLEYLVKRYPTLKEMLDKRRESRGNQEFDITALEHINVEINGNDEMEWEALFDLMCFYVQYWSTQKSFVDLSSMLKIVISAPPFEAIKKASCNALVCYWIVNFPAVCLSQENQTSVRAIRRESAILGHNTTNKTVNHFRDLLTTKNLI